MHYAEACDGYAAQGIPRIDAEIVKKAISGWKLVRISHRSNNISPATAVSASTEIDTIADETRVSITFYPAAFRAGFALTL